jgi:tetratricopeptide (TPR) repeat protein
MPNNPPNGLRPYLRTQDPKLATAADSLWDKSRPLHDRQNRPDSNENGRKHVEMVERNIWRLLTETRDQHGKLNLENFEPRELFLLSAAACCHDFDKALKSGERLPKPFKHGEGSAAFVKINADLLGLDEHQAKEVAAAIGLHHLQADAFKHKLEALSPEEGSPDGPFNLRRVAVLLKAADILHCDHSRIPALGIDPHELAEDQDELERSKYVARKCTKGWMAEGRRILIQADPDDAEAYTAIRAGFDFMKTQEWPAVADGLSRWSFPYELVLKTPQQADPSLGTAVNLLESCPEPQDRWVGRKTEMDKLRRAWRGRRRRIQAIVGFGGEGKTALARRFTDSLLRASDAANRPLVLWWSFYFNKAADSFFSAALTHLGIPLTEQGHPLSAEERARKLVDLLRTGLTGPTGLAGRRLLLVLDGLETMQDDTIGREGRVTDTGLRELFRATLDDSAPDTPARGMILVTTREALTDLRRQDDPRFGHLPLEQLSVEDGAALLIRQYGLKIEQDDAERFVQEVGGHALTLTLTGGLHAAIGATTNLAELRQFIAGEEAQITDHDLTTRREKFHRLPGYVLRHCADALSEQECQFLRLLSCCVRPATRQDIEQVFLHRLKTSRFRFAFNRKLARRDYISLRNTVILRLLRLPLIHGNEDTGYDMHPLVRRHFYEDDARAALTAPQRQAVHSRFFDVLPGRQTKHHPETLEEMRPLIDAVQHGCRAGRSQVALDDCYYTRIHRGAVDRTTGYLDAVLGAVETDLELLRGFFPDGGFSAEPTVTKQADKVYLIGTAALVLSATGRPDVAVPMSERALTRVEAQSDWANASSVCRNLCDSHVRLGRLAQAAEAAAKALDYAGRMPDERDHKKPFTEFSRSYAAIVAAFRGDDAAADRHFAAALELNPRDWLASMPGGRRCTWLARRGELDRARSNAESNARACEMQGGLLERSFSLATQALVERLAWEKNDPMHQTLDAMQSYADRAIETGRRSSHHYYLTCALLEAGRCAVARAEFDLPALEQAVKDAEQHLAEAQSRADDAGYRLILADLHVARARLAKIAGDHEQMHHHCRQALAICEAPDCGYAWPKQDAQPLLAP